MAGFNFGQVFQSADPSQAWQRGVEMRQSQEDRARAIAQAETKAQQDAEYRSRMGEILRSSAPDRYAAASAAASHYGDAAAAQNYYNLSKQGYDRADASTVALANMANDIAAQPYETRMGIIQSLKPRLVALGYDAAEIDAFDPTDANLAALAGIEYNKEMRVDDANTAYGNETDRISATNPVVVGSSLVTRGGEELYRAPELQSFGLDENVYEVGGVSSSGYSTNLSVDQTYERMIGVESNGQQFGKDGRPLTSSAGAIGIAQVMPSTAPEAARLAGLPFDERRYRTDSSYNRALGEAYFKEQVRVFDGDLVKASAAYNAGAGNVRRAIRRAEQRGGDWTQYLPAETRDYITKVHGRRDTTSKMRQVQQGTPKPTGGGADGSGGGKPLTSAQEKNLSAAADGTRNLARLVETFNDNYGGNILGGVENFAQRINGNIGTKGQQQWWADMAALDNVLRNALFGSALTEHEKRAWEGTTVSPSMDPKLIRQNLNRRMAIMRGVTDRIARGYVAGGRNREQVSIATEGLGVDVGGGSGGILTVRTRAEAEALPSGTIFRTPDGKTRRKQ